MTSVDTHAAVCLVTPGSSVKLTSTSAALHLALIMVILFLIHNFGPGSLGTP